MFGQVLMTGGMFICRVHELLSRLSAALVYLMYRMFEEVLSTLLHDYYMNDALKLCVGIGRTDV